MPSRSGAASRRACRPQGWAGRLDTGDSTVGSRAGAARLAARSRDVVVQVSDAVALADLGIAELDRPGCEGSEQPYSLAEQDWHQLDLNPLDEAKSQTLLNDARAAQRDDVVPGHLLGRRHRA